MLSEVLHVCPCLTETLFSLLLGLLLLKGRFLTRIDKELSYILDTACFVLFFYDAFFSLAAPFWRRIHFTLKSNDIKVKILFSSHPRKQFWMSPMEPKGLDCVPDLCLSWEMDAPTAQNHIMPTSMPAVATGMRALQSWGRVWERHCLPDVTIRHFEFSATSYRGKIW